MVTQRYNENSIQVIYLKSSETKPTNTDNGSVVVEVDTGKCFRFDEENSRYYECNYMDVML